MPSRSTKKGKALKHEIVVSIPTNLLKLTRKDKDRLKDLFRPVFVKALGSNGVTEDEGEELSITTINT